MEEASNSTRSVCHTLRGTGASTYFRCCAGRSRCNTATRCSRAHWREPRSSCCRPSSARGRLRPGLRGPASGLNLTSTKPLSSELSRSTHQGKVPVPDCCRTLGRLGSGRVPPAPPSAGYPFRSRPAPSSPEASRVGRCRSRSWSAASAPLAASTPPTAIIVFFIRAPIPARRPVQEQSLDAPCANACAKAGVLGTGSLLGTPA